jgi:hypothetical protein
MFACFRNLPVLRSVTAFRVPFALFSSQVLNPSVGKEVSWEDAPQGMAPEGSVAPTDGAGVAAPGPPLPYPGTGRLVPRMQRALRGFVQLVVKHGVPIIGALGGADSGAGQWPQPAGEAEARGSTQPSEQEPPRDGDGAAPPPQQRGEGCLATLGTWSEVVQVR